ncbi:MAG TPA: hypothetical protein ENJ56_09275, partial [Anaerolineae bacterium]|nr:hypothetical protein [Anaerolineae bacterium]
MRKLTLLLALILLLSAFFFFRWWNPVGNQALTRWAVGDSAERASLIVSKRDTCASAPFALPTDGFIGLL